MHALTQRTLSDTGTRAELAPWARRTRRFPATKGTRRPRELTEKTDTMATGNGPRQEQREEGLHLDCWKYALETIIFSCIHD